MTDCPAPDLDAALALALELTAIPGRSGDEAAVAAKVAAVLTAAGVPAELIRRDDSHLKTGLKPPAGSVPSGCLSAVLPGRGELRDAPRRMLSAHLDTVPLAVGCEPVRDGETIQSGNPATALGADDRAGVAAVLTAVRAVLNWNGPHPPLTVFFPVQEEVGVRGSRYADLSLLGDPAVCINFDGSDPAGVIVGATGQTEMRIAVAGKPAHAGLNPELGVNAAVVAAVALADLHAAGWHGKIARDGGAGTANVGVLSGGDATNVVMPRCELTVECRSHDPAFREAIVRAWRAAFERAPRKVVAADGTHASVEFETHLKYDSFRLSGDSPAVRVAEAAVREAGGRGRAAPRRRQRRVGRQLAHRPRPPHRHAGVRSAERAYDRGAAGHRRFFRRLPSSDGHRLRRVVRRAA